MRPGRKGNRTVMEFVLYKNNKEQQNTEAQEERRREEKENLKSVHMSNNGNRKRDSSRNEKLCV